MLSGICAAQNTLGASHDVWAINVETEYLEEARVADKTAGDRLVPQPVTGVELEELLQGAFARYDPLALGISLGVVMGLGMFLVTAALLLQGGEPLGPNLSLLGAYFLGFEVSWRGALLGTLEAMIGGFFLGALMAGSINLLVSVFEESVRRKLELVEILDPLERHDT